MHMGNKVEGFFLGLFIVTKGKLLEGGENNECKDRTTFKEVK